YVSKRHFPSRSARRAPETVTVRELLKREPGLKLESAIVGAFGESAVPRPGRLVRLPKQRGGDVAEDRSGIVVIGNVADLHRDGHAISMIRRAAALARTALDGEWARGSSAGALDCHLRGCGAAFP